MTHTHKKSLGLFATLALLFVLAACSMPGSTSSPEQTLANSASAMSKLNSVHFTLQTTVNVTGNSGSSNGLTYKVNGQGDAAAPDKVSLQLTDNGPLLNLISSGSHVYIQVKGGSWTAVSKDQIQDAEQNFFSQSLATRLGQMMSAVENAQLTDHGQETVDGASLDHITATLDAQTLQTLSSELNQLAPASAQSSQNKINKAVLDVWIDTTTSYVHQAQIDIATQVDASALEHFTGQQIGVTGTLPIELKAQVNFSNFNQPVTIQPPTM